MVLNCPEQRNPCWIQKHSTLRENTDGFYNLIIKLSLGRMPSQRWEINYIFCFFWLLLFPCVLPILFYDLLNEGQRGFLESTKPLRPLISEQEKNGHGLRASSQEPAKRGFNLLPAPLNPRINPEDTRHDGTSSPAPWRRRRLVSKQRGPRGSWESGRAVSSWSAIHTPELARPPSVICCLHTLRS